MAGGLAELDGLTEEERLIVEALFQANSLFAELPEQHPLDTGEWMSHLHALQGLIAVRVCRRDYPRGWPSYPSDEGR